MASRSKFRRLAVEALDDRRVPAGNVLASLHGMDLVVRADAADDQAQLVQIADGKVQVREDSGTTVVNGKPMFEAPGRVHGVDVRMEQGRADQFVIQGTSRLAESLDVRPGADAVLVEGSARTVAIGKGLRVRTEADGDVARPNEVRVGGQAKLGAGATLKVVAGRGSDSLTVDDLHVRFVPGPKDTGDVPEEGQLIKNTVVDVPPQTIGTPAQVGHDRVLRVDGQLKADHGSFWHVGRGDELPVRPGQTPGHDFGRVVGSREHDGG
jgi:hypothetical protein